MRRQKQNRQTLPWGLPVPVCQRSLAEFADGSRQIKSNHFLPGRVPGRKYFSGRKCANCAPMAHKACAQRTAKVWRKAPKGVFDMLSGHPPYQITAAPFLPGPVRSDMRGAPRMPSCGYTAPDRKELPPYRRLRPAYRHRCPVF